jgi:hypothetical protein
MKHSMILKTAAGVIFLLAGTHASVAAEPAKVGAQF